MDHSQFLRLSHLATVKGLAMHGTFGQAQSDMLDAQTSARLSARLRQARQMRGMTLRMVAGEAGCSESLLSKIENGKAYPSLPMLARLVKALDVEMGWMFDARNGDEPIIFRAGPRAVAPVDRPITVERVIPESDRHALRCNILHVEAGASSDGEHQHAGEEVGYLVDGQLELLIGGRSHHLHAGDAFAFRSDQPHGWRNVGATRASVFWVNTPSLM